MVNNLSDFICNQTANSKCLVYAWINKNARDSKKIEKIYTINRSDVDINAKLIDSQDRKTISGSIFLDKQNSEEDEDIIRIEAEDGSEDYIEIIFPKENRDWTDTAKDIGLTLLDYTATALDFISMGPHPVLKLGKPLSKGVKVLSKSIRSINDLTDKQRRIYDMVMDLPYAKKHSKLGKYNDGSNIRLVENQDKLDQLWEQLITGVHIDEEIRITDKIINGKRVSEKITFRVGYVDDSMRIQYRSSSSNLSHNKPTIDIDGGTNSTKLKVHIDVSKDKAGEK